MSFEITSSAHPGMLVLRARGTGNAAKGHRAFEELQAHREYYQGLPILVDATDLEYAPSAAMT